jgi:hypothetical protein|tara:strand:+ start:557 stop:1015 length:459 start_codon:yes stop_codon:yes gene_type:complete
MSNNISISRNKDEVVQFSINAENKVGRLNEILSTLAKRDIHLVAITTLDTTDSTIIRMIVNYPEEAIKTFNEMNLFYGERQVIAVEFPAITNLQNVTRALIEAEINIHYLYSFLSRPNGKSALAMRVDDPDFAKKTLHLHQLKILNQHDIAR